MSVTAEWFRTENKDIQTTQNLNRARTTGDPAQNPNYQAFSVFSPLDGNAVTVYDVASAAVSSLAANNLVFTDNDQTSVYNGFDLGLNMRLPHGARIFGGTTTERTLNNNCDLGGRTARTNLLYCDQSNLGGGYSIPWKTQIKLAGTYPLPWWGLILNGSYQGLPGYSIGNTTYSISKTTTYTVCPGTSAAAGCTAKAIVIPGQIGTTVSVPLDPSGVDQTPRNNQLDFGLAKRVKIGRVRLDPKIDLFNALNSSDYYSVVSTTFSPILNSAAADPVHSPALPALSGGTLPTTYHQPARFLQGRIVRLGLNVTW